MLILGAWVSSTNQSGAVSASPFKAKILVRDPFLIRLKAAYRLSR